MSEKIYLCIYFQLLSFTLPETLTARVMGEQCGLLPHGGTTCPAEGLPGRVPHLSLLPGPCACPPVAQGKTCNGAVGLSAVELLAPLSLWPPAHDAAGWWIRDLSG